MEHGIFNILNRDYSSWEISDTNTSKKINVSKNFNPISARAFSGDIVYENGTIELTSSIRTKVIPGILVLTGATYGRHKRQSFLYKCIPYDKQIPVFLVPYTYKKQTFEKRKQNKYVLFNFSNWNSKHPIGTLQETIGCVSNLEAYYSYSLYCHNLWVRRKTTLPTSIKHSIYRLNEQNSDFFVAFHKHTARLQNKISSEIITIDPAGSTDLDDALGAEVNPNGSWKISIHIANVPLWMQILQYWEHLSLIEATIYMPNKKISMFPASLGDNLFSLLENKQRLAISMNVCISNNGTVTSVDFTPSIISVKKNYVYEEEQLLNNCVYKAAKDAAIACNKQKKYMSSISDSHAVVAFWMILMNSMVGDILFKSKTGIFRTIAYKKTTVSRTKNIPEDVARIAEVWGSKQADYTDASKNKGHALIGNGIASYAHATSPIRRLVDIVNLARLQALEGILSFPNEVILLLHKYENAVASINDRMKKINKVQNDCLLLTKCSKWSREQDNSYTFACTGYVIHSKNDTPDVTTYGIYLPELNIVRTITTSHVWNVYDKGQFNIYVFDDEHTLHRKIRISRIDTSLQPNVFSAE